MIVRQEPLSWMLRDGLESIAFLNWQEIERDLNAQPFDINWQALLDAERSCSYQVVAARAGAALVGYSSYFCDAGYRSRQTRIARNDAIYLLPKYRRGWNGAKLIREGERILLASGASRVVYGTTMSYEGGRLGKLFARMGYAKAGEYYSRVLI
jgi:GNAT superfamily N-acetyltransferase